MEHPLSQFRYCPKCGSEHFEIHNEKSKQCKDCGFVYYFNSSAATVALILNGRNELLVCRRAKEPAKGTLDLPGGFIDMAETGEEGVACEGKAETGIIRHFALATEDVDTCVEKLKAAGYKVFVEPKDIVIPSNPEYKARIAFGRGPLGEEIEFFQER
jgi:predicted nucleic-acid-binding Zn-ribbon protein